MKLLFLIVVFFSVLFFISCKQNELPHLEKCETLTTLEEARDLMSDIRDNRFTDSDIIKQSIIGEWILIGMVPGWTGFEKGKECINLTINANTIELVDNITGEKSSTNWELLPFEVNGYSGFYLETNEDVWNNRIGMDVFSNNVMYGAGRADDTNTYIYEKLN